ncbi:MAG: GNAT family N-acetyltransferase [Bdellovibrio sp.]|nr:GNAT family N-acetyltransferase [Bdellovibrio sp.]
MKSAADNYTISTDKSLLQRSKIHRFLSEKAYWSLGIPKEFVNKAIDKSLCFGLYEESSGDQIGFARIVTDETTFAWLCDVYVEEDFRGQGLSKKMMEAIVSHPDLQGLRRFCLTTKDGHSLYQKFGFQVTKTPDFFMEIKDNDIYKRLINSVIN